MRAYGAKCNRYSKCTRLRLTLCSTITFFFFFSFFAKTVLLIFAKLRVGWLTSLGSLAASGRTVGASLRKAVGCSPSFGMRASAAFMLIPLLAHLGRREDWDSLSYPMHLCDQLAAPCSHSICLSCLHSLIRKARSNLWIVRLDSKFVPCSTRLCFPLVILILRFRGKCRDTHPKNRNQNGTLDYLNWSEKNQNARRWH